MFPNQPQPLTTSSYLDEISAPTPQKTLNPFVLWGLIGGALLVVVTVFLLLMNAGGPSYNQRLTLFVYRVNALQSLSSDNSRNIQDSKLLAINAQLNSVLAGISQQSPAPLATAGIAKLPKEPKDSPVAAEYATLATTLDNARLNVVFDRTYAREIAFQLSTLRSETTFFTKNTRSSSLKAFLASSDASFKTLEEQFENFNEGS